MEKIYIIWVAQNSYLTGESKSPCLMRLFGVDSNRQIRIMLYLYSFYTFTKLKTESK